MAILRAALIGSVAALALPYVTRNHPLAFGGLLDRGVVNLTVSHYHFSWSWPAFCVVTLLAWACFAIAER